MRSLRIDQVKPGDVTANRVLNSSGGTLIGAGTALTEGIIRSLKTAGVEVVEVEGGEALGADRVAQIAQRIEELETRCEGISDPFLLEIKMAAMSRLQSMLPTEAP